MKYCSGINLQTITFHTFACDSQNYMVNSFGNDFLENPISVTQKNGFGINFAANSRDLRKEDQALQIPTSQKCSFGLVHGRFLPFLVVVHLPNLGSYVEEPCKNYKKIKSDVLENPVILSNAAMIWIWTLRMGAFGALHDRCSVGTRHAFFSIKSLTI